MTRVLAITILVWIFYLIEFLLFNFFGKWFTPNLLLILIIFFNLYLGIRYSLLTAVIAGIFKDSFSIDFFGLNILSFVICAFLTTLIKRYLYQIGSISSRVLMVFLVTMASVFINFILDSMLSVNDFQEMIVHILFPEVLVTTVMASYVWGELKKCMVRFSIR